MTLAEAPPYGTDAWVAWRRNGLGASDIPAILGVDPYRGEYALALDKKGMAPDRPQTRAMSWGHRMEEVGAQEYTERTGRILEPGGSANDPRWPHVFASPDRRVVGEPGLVELKWTSRWDEPPRHVLVQCQVQMATTGAQWVDVVRMGPYGEPAIHRIDRDATAEALCDLAEAWYVRYVLGNEMPDVDGSQAASRHLDTLVGPAEPVEADDDQMALMMRLHDVRKEALALKAEDKLLVNQIKASMVGGGVLIAKGIGRVTWKPRKGSTRTAWELVASAYRQLVPDTVPAEDLDTLVDLHTATGKGSHPFVPRWDDGLEEEEAP